MKTTKPISTISFNTEAYLRLKLEELRKAKRISFWAYIKHIGEDDEAGKKDHFHVYAIPSKMILTDDVREHFVEPDPDKPDKPKGTLLWVSSKWEDWYLYGLHDAEYLESKQLVKKYHYSALEMRSSDDDELLLLVRTIDRTVYSLQKRMRDAIEQGVTKAMFFSQGCVPINLVSPYSMSWDLLEEGKRQREALKKPDLERKEWIEERITEDGEIINETK